MSDQIVKIADFDDIDALFDGVSSETAITPTPEVKTVLSQDEEVNLDPLVLNQKTPEELAAEAEKAKATPASNPEDDEPLSFDDLTKQAEEDNKTQGRSKTDKSGLVELYMKNILEGKMDTFDDFQVAPDDPKYKEELQKYLSKFSMKDFEELHESNLIAKTQEIEEKVPQAIFEALPRELQFAYKYVNDGGTDMKGLFKALSQVEEVKALDPVKDAREVAFQYLKATNFGTEEEINDQLSEWEDLNKLEQKSEQFKPKLDKMQQQIVEAKLQEQEQQKIQREEAAKKYVSNVTTALKTPELAGIKLDSKTHQFLTKGLLEPVYQSAVTGQRTNMLGYLLEKHQMIEPNYQLVAEALWLLSDPETYRSKLIEKGKTEQTVKTVRELKGEQQRRMSSTSINEDTRDDQGRNVIRRGVQRPNNVLRRN